MYLSTPCPSLIVDLFIGYWLLLLPFFVGILCFSMFYNVLISGLFLNHLIEKERAQVTTLFVHWLSGICNSSVLSLGRGSRNFCQIGSKFYHVSFLIEGGGVGSEYHFMRAIISPPAKRHENGLLMMAQH